MSHDDPFKGRFGDPFSPKPRDATATGSIGKWTLAWAQARELPVQYFDHLESTNTFAKNEFNEASVVEKTKLFVSDEQTQGRGRASNTWLGSKGTALYASWCFSVPSAPQPILSPLVGLALFEAFQDTWSFLNFSIKAPNDIYLDDRKLAGILIEVVERGRSRRVVIGTGVNVHSAPREVATAISLSEKAPVEEAQWNQFLTAFMWRLQDAIWKGQLTDLDRADAGKLREALNRNPNLKEKVTNVDAKGQIETWKGVIPWHEL